MYQHILVPLDSSGNADRALKEALSLAAVHRARLRLLHVVESVFPVGEADVLSHEELNRQMREQGQAVLAEARAAAAAAGVEADTVLREVEGRVADAIVEEAAGAGCDLVVMGTHGRRGVSRLLFGSDAELVSRTSPVPVLLVRQEAP